MRSLSVITAVSLITLVSGEGSSSTSGFPTLDDIRGNASLLDRFSIHDGEVRSVPVTFSEECFNTGTVMITKIRFTALPGVGDNDIELVISRSLGSNLSISLNEASQSFGDFGYEQVFVQPFELLAMDSFWIDQPKSSLRLLYQVGDDMLNISWSSEIENHGYIYNETAYDYPLLAIETDPLNCIMGLQNISELKNMWEHRPPPVVYSSPYREIPLECNGTGIVMRILAGAYEVMSGDQAPYIEINDCVCNPSSQPALNENLSVYECILDSPVPVNVNDLLHVHQRNSDFQIVSIHDGQTDIPLISIDISGECDSNGFVSEDELMDLASLYIPTFCYIDNDIILFTELRITQPGYLVKWVFATDLLEGVEYPALQMYRNLQRVIATNSEPSRTIYPNVYESIIDPPFLVQAGDIVGFGLPENARLSLIIILNYGSVGGESLRGNGMVDGLPLVSLGIVLNVTETSVLPTPVITSFKSNTDHNLVPTSPLPSTQCSPSETDMMCENKVQETNDAIMNIIIGVVCSLCLLIAVTIAILLILVWFKKQRRKPKVVNTVTYASHSSEIKTDTNTAYHTVNNDVISHSTTSAATHHSQPATLSSERALDFATSQNEAYAASGVTLSVNPAYGLVESSAAVYNTIEENNENALE